MYLQYSTVVQLYRTGYVSPDCGDGHLPLARLLLALLLDHGADGLGLGLLLPVQQVGGDRAGVLGSLRRLLALLLLVRLDRLLHLDLLPEPLLVVDLGLEPPELLGDLAPLVRLPIIINIIIIIIIIII